MPLSTRIQQGRAARARQRAGELPPIYFRRSAARRRSSVQPVQECSTVRGAAGSLVGLGAGGNDGSSRTSSPHSEAARLGQPRRHHAGWRQAQRYNSFWHPAMPQRTTGQNGRIAAMAQIIERVAEQTFTTGALYSPFASGRCRPEISNKTVGGIARERRNRILQHYLGVGEQNGRPATMPP